MKIYLKIYLRLAASLGVAGVLLGCLMVGGGVGLGQITSALTRLSVSVYAAALGLHALTYTMRAMRFNLLLPPRLRPSLRRMLVVSAAHNMASYVLPAKTGEASFILYLRMRCGVSTREGLACLLAARFLDGAALLFSISLMGLWLAFFGDYPVLREFVWLVGGMFVLSLFFLGLSLRGDLPVRLLETLLRRLHVNRWRRGRTLVAGVSRLATSLRSKGTYTLAVSAFATLAIWLSIFSFFTLLATSMGLTSDVGMPEVAFSSGLGSFCNLLPINGMAGMGTQEIGWVGGLHRIFGVDYELALSTAIGVHCVQIFNVVAAGLVAHLFLGVMPRLVDLEREEEVAAQLSSVDPRSL